jgi:hypothetical protein
MQILHLKQMKTITPAEGQMKTGGTEAMISKTVHLSSSSDMKGRLRNNKGLKWNGLYLSNNLHRHQSSEEWNAEVKMYSLKMIITTSEETDMEEEGMDREY